MSDLISRQAAISLPVKPKEDRYFQTQNLDDAYDYGWCDLQRCIEKLPPAQLERKKGKWNFIGDNMFECTYCGVAYTTQQLNGLRNYNVDPYAPKFCPNCGADMRGEQDE